MSDIPSDSGSSSTALDEEAKESSSKSLDEADEEKGIVSDTTVQQDASPTSDPTEEVDEDTLFVEVPAPGFQFASASLLVGQMTSRLVPNVCSICLCNYYPGNKIVWSSNEACEHVFHESCILQWIMKQREGPLCPCCRRDFVLDPYDMDDEEIDPEAVAVSIPSVMAAVPEGLEGDVEDESVPSSSAEAEESEEQRANATDSAVLDYVTLAQEAALAFHMEEGRLTNSAREAEDAEAAIRPSENPEGERE